MESRSAGASLLKRGIVVMMLLLLFGSSAFVVIYLSLRGRTVRVPSVVGMRESAAQDELEGEGLVMQVSGRAPHPEVPAGGVSDQSPAAGTVVKTGQLVRVTLSLGVTPGGPERAP